MLEVLKTRVVSNTFWLLSANLLTKIIAFGYNIFLARSFGPANYGLFVFGLTLFGLVSSIADFGIARFLTRDLSKNSGKAAELTSKTFSLSLFISSIISVLLILTLIVFDRNAARVIVGSVMIATVFPNTLSQIITATFTALEKMRYVAFGLIFLNLSVTALGVIALLVFNLNVAGVAVGFLISHFLFLVLFYVFLIREKIKLVFIFNSRVWIRILQSSIPYGLLTILGLVYFRIDSVLLTYLRGTTETGFYGASYRFLDAVQFIPIAVSTALFPTFVRLHENSILDLKKIYFKSVALLSILGLIVASFLFLLAPVIINLVYGAGYQPSIIALEILSFAIFFQFIHIPGAHLLFATEKFLKPVIYLSILAVGFNIIANLIFIPSYGFVAAAAITVLSEILSFLIFFGFILIKVFAKNA